MRSQFHQQFAQELEVMSDEESVAVIDILVTLFTFEGLEVMWRQLDNDHDAVAQRWRVAMTSLLSPKSLTPPPAT